jgi:hypothetical protein
MMVLCDWSWLTRTFFVWVMKGRVLSMFVLGIFLCVLSTVVSAEEMAVDSTGVVNVPRRAMLRSLVLPGWGQFYNGKKIKGGVIAAVEVGSAVAYFVRRDQLRRAGSSERNVYFFTTIGVVLYGMADAYVDAYLDRVDWAEVEMGVSTDGAAQFRVRFQLESVLGRGR